MSLISPSRFLLLMIHPSSLLFLHGHFETNPDYDLTADSDIHMILPYFPVLKVQEMRHSAPASRSSATWPDQMQTQVMSPRSSTWSLPWIMTRCSSTIRSTISPTSRKPRTRTLNNLVFPQCLNPLFRSVLLMILLFRWKARKACSRETVAGQREIEEWEGFVLSAAESTSKERLTEQYWESFSSDSPKILLWRATENTVLKTHRKFYSDGWDLREHFQRRAQQAILGENSDQRREYLTEYMMEIQNLKRRNSEYELFKSQRKVSQRVYLCSILEMKDIFIKNAMQEVAEKLKNWEYAAMGRKLRNKRRCEEYLTQHDQESRKVSLFFCDPDSLSIYDIAMFLIKLLLHRVRKNRAAKLECREIHERMWVFLETFLIVNMLDEILINYTMIQKIWRYHWRFWEKKELRIVGAKKPLQSTPLPCFSVRARRKRLDDKQVLCLWLTMPGYLDLYSSGLTIPSHLHSDLHL